MASPIEQFKDAMTAVKQQDMFNKFPVEGIRSFKIDETTKRFEVVLDGTYTGKATYRDPDNQTMVDRCQSGYLKVHQKVTGVMGQDKLVLDSGCYEACKNIFLSAWVVGVELKEEDKKASVLVTGKLLGIEGSTSISMESLIIANVEWKKA